MQVLQCMPRRAALRPRRTSLLTTPLILRLAARVQRPIVTRPRRISRAQIVWLHTTQETWATRAPSTLREFVGGIAQPRKMTPRKRKRGNSGEGSCFYTFITFFFSVLCLPVTLHYHPFIKPPGNITFSIIVVKCFEKNALVIRHLFIQVPPVCQSRHLRGG